jgi:outer membrane protein assembly factor BamA
MLTAIVLALGLWSSQQGAVFGGEVVAAIRIQGNLLTTDEEVRRLAGVEIGMAVAANTPEIVAARLRQTRRFKRVEVLKRFASIADPTQIVMVVIVDEGPVAIDWGPGSADGASPARVVRRRSLHLMFLPIVSFEDGYGLAYGARVGRAGPFGRRSHLSVPLTWGGDKRAAIDVDKPFRRGPLSGIAAGASADRRRHPFFRIDDDQQRLWLTARRTLGSSLAVSATTAWQHVVLGEAADRFLQTGADLVFDTRLDPMLPRNAVYARTAWEHSGIPSEHEGGVNRITLDGRGYVGLPGQSVLVIRALREDADRPLPPYLKSMLGGMETLRGFRRGTAVGDTLVAGSIEVRTPLTSPLHLGRFGVMAFVDAASTYDKGRRLDDQPIERAVGGGIWFSAAMFRLNLAVAHGIGGTTRVHFGTTLSP